MGREVGVGIGMGKTCEPKAFSFQCMTEFTTNKNKLKKKKRQCRFCVNVSVREKVAETQQQEYAQGALAG